MNIDTRGLSPRQFAVASELVCNGSSNKVIAHTLGLKEATVKVHLRNIMKKFGVTNRAQIVIRMSTKYPAVPRDAGCW